MNSQSVDAERIYCRCDFYLIVNGPLGDIAEMYRIDLHQIFTIGIHMTGHDQPDLLFAIAQGKLTRFLAQIGENWHTPPSFCALAFHNGREDRNTDALNTADDRFTADKCLVKFAPVTHAFCRRDLRRAGYTLGFAMHF